jgi:DNA-binding response OmpR family regulator
MLNINVLIVDDELGIRHGLSQFFKKEGFTVYTAEDKASMEAVVKEFHIDIILLDLRLKPKLSDSSQNGVGSTII